MARIRSIHPGLFTDEAFMSASAHARLLIIGIWCEAWDDGVFEWKPLTLKARIFPVDAVDVNALLSELAELQFVCRFESGGKLYGAIRNFQRFQRPKKPNSSGALLPSLASYVGQGETSSEPVPDPSPTGGGKSPQMEDGEGTGEEEKKNNSEADASGAVAPQAAGSRNLVLVSPEPVYTDAVHELFGEGVAALVALGEKESRARQMIGLWRKQTGDDCAAVLKAIVYARNKRVSNPIPYITASLKPGDNHAQPARKSEVFSAFDRLGEKLTALGGS